MTNSKSFRNDALAKVTGRAQYTDDIKIHDMLHAVPVYSDFVHAKVIAIHTEKAATMPGVVKIITYKDVTGCNIFGQIIKDLRYFAEDKIRYNGDVVALIVAKTRKEAMAAIPLVTVDAEELPAILDMEEALADNTKLVHENHGSNLINTHCIRRGDYQAGFADCDYIEERIFKTQHIEHSYMEPESAICIPRHDGVYEILGSMQHPFSTRRFTANLIGESLSNVEVVGVSVGGGFGGKDDTAAIVCARAALAAKLTGKPVKITYTREWSIRESYKRHPYKIYYKMGFSKDGLIKAVDTKIIADGGAYCSVTPWVTWRSTVQCCGPYMVKDVNCDTYGVYTNNVFTGAMRGFGSPQLNFVIEQMVEIAAEKCNMDSVELRRLNMVKQDSTTITEQKLDTHIVSLDEVLSKVMTEIGYTEKLKKCSKGKDTGEQYGIGLAISYRGMSLGAEGTDFCAAIINVQFDGTVLVETGIHENGQGSESAMMLIAAEQLGLPIEKIRYRRNSTSNIPDSGTTVASRGTIMGGGAIKLAADELKKKLNKLAAKLLDITDEKFAYQNEKLISGDKEIAFKEVIQKMFANQEFPHSLGVFKAPRVSWDEHIGKGDAYFTWVYSCQAVEIMVDPKTKKVRLLNAVCAHDVGKAINHEMVKGQMFGGMAMSTGYALHEKLQFNEGKITSLNFDKYRIPRAKDLPEMTAIIVENYDPQSPTGAKGLGEPVNEIMAPAIANAIYNATGKRYYELPITLVDSE